MLAELTLAVGVILLRPLQPPPRTLVLVELLVALSLDSQLPSRFPWECRLLPIHLRAPILLLPILLLVRQARLLVAPSPHQSLLPPPPRKFNISCGERRTDLVKDVSNSFKFDEYIFSDAHIGICANGHTHPYRLSNRLYFHRWHQCSLRD